MGNRWLKLLAAGATLMPLAASAYTFMPTKLEFASWPQYCRARYVETVIGRQSEFAPLVSQAERRAAEASIGRESYTPVHHHCAGMAWLARSKIEQNAQVRTHMLRTARDESSYTLRGITPASPLYASVNANLARVEQALGNVPRAEQYYESVIEAKPAESQAYVGLAILYKDTKRLALSRTTLEKGLAATDTEGVELHYNLGLICLELKDTDCAQQHARAAYEKGYPLPGLKRKLAQLGLQIE